MPSIAIMLLFLMCNGGCLTAAMWSDANSPTTKICGVSATSPGGKMLLVRYQHARERSTLEIPLMADGRPVAAFAYLGSPLTEEDMLEQIPADQRAAILKTSGDIVRGDGPVQASTGDCKDTDPNSDLTIYSDEAGKGLALIPYRISGETISLAKVPSRGHEAAYQQELEADLRRDPALFAVVPAERVRPVADRQRSQVTAAMLTPLTVPADAAILVTGAILYPVVWVYAQVFWHGEGC
jgi:hypothetical protein